MKLEVNYIPKKKEGSPLVFGEFKTEYLPYTGPISKRAIYNDVVKFETTHPLPIRVLSWRVISGGW